MKKTHKHDELSNVECANSKCREVNGKQGNGPRKFIKQRIVDQFGTDRPLYCYKCGKSLKGKFNADKYMTAGS